MKKNFIILLSFIASLTSTACEEENYEVKKSAPIEENVKIPEKAIVVAEQSRNSILIVNAETNEVVWNWDALIGNIPVSDRYLFGNPSEVKPVCNNKYILMTASAGAVALIRISDHKVMCYSKCGTFPNPHSAELLPDGNIVIAESRNNEINIIKTDFENGTCELIKDRKIGSAHNVVWDNEHQYLYLTGVIVENGESTTALFRLKYNNQKNAPKFTNQERVYTFNQEPGGHDLFPVYGEKGKLWLTTEKAVHKVDVNNPKEIKSTLAYSLSNIKSVSNGPDGIILLQPTGEWWSDQLINEQGNSILKLNYSKIYKARWMLRNTFSYPDNHELN